ncbi:MAG: hypothetical protein ACXIVO_13820 [Glycocaulis sp.]
MEMIATDRPGGEARRRSSRQRQNRIPSRPENAVTPIDRVAALVGGMSVLARELGVSDGTIYGWRQNAEARDGNDGRFPDTRLDEVRAVLARLGWRDVSEAFLTEPGAQPVPVREVQP